MAAGGQGDAIMIVHRVSLIAVAAFAVLALSACGQTTPHVPVSGVYGSVSGGATAARDTSIR